MLSVLCKIVLSFKDEIGRRLIEGVDENTGKDINRGMFKHSVDTMFPLYRLGFTSL